MFDVIAFDADDTLWNNEFHYRKARIKFQKICARYKDPEEAGQLLDEIEKRNLPLYGYGIKSFSLSMIESAIQISNGKITGKEIGQILTITQTMLDADIDLIEHVEETLAALCQRYHLMLITKGDPSEQEKKIQRSGLMKYFRYIEITGEKNLQTYQVILKKYRIDPARFLMIGNSLKSDILPALEAGGQAIYIPHPHTWSHEMAPENALSNAGFVQIEQIGRLSEVINHLQDETT